MLLASMLALGGVGNANAASSASEAKGSQPPGPPVLIRVLGAVPISRHGVPQYWDFINNDYTVAWNGPVDVTYYRWAEYGYNPIEEWYQLQDGAGPLPRQRFSHTESESEYDDYLRYRVWACNPAGCSAKSAVVDVELRDPRDWFDM